MAERRRIGGGGNGWGALGVVWLMHPAWSRLAGILGFGLGALTVPHRLCAMGTGAWYDGDPSRQEQLARRVARWIDGAPASIDFSSRSTEPSEARAGPEGRRPRRAEAAAAGGAMEGAFSTGSPRFDSEWRFGTYQMAALGFGQLALEHPESRAGQRVRMEHAIDRMLSAEGQRFDTEAWDRDALSTLDASDGHVAYLGYTNLALGLHRSLWPDSRYAEANDAITQALVRRYELSEIRLLETYPGEIYPLDNSAAIASIALHARATHRAEPQLVREWSDLVRRKYLHADTNLLYQAVDASGTPVDAPRGSGTALAAYFLSFGDAELSATLHHAVQRALARDVLGFGAVREYPDFQGAAAGRGDIDSGPLVFGYGVSATGFSIAGCRVHGDEDCYRAALATAWLFGAPLSQGDELGYVAGGPLGDAILFAMQTAQRRNR